MSPSRVNGWIEGASQLSAMFDGELTPRNASCSSRRAGARPGAADQLGALCADRRGDARRATGRALAAGGDVAARSRRRAVDGSRAAGKDEAAQRASRGCATVALAWRDGGRRRGGVAACRCCCRTADAGGDDGADGAARPAVHPDLAGAVAAASPAHAPTGASWHACRSWACGDPPATCATPVRHLPAARCPAPLANYVVAHSEYSSPLARRGLLSALVSSDSGSRRCAARGHVVDEGADAVALNR